MNYQYFTLDEFKCQETGDNSIKPHFVKSLDELRDDCGFPFSVTSGYRSPSHSVERNKTVPGTHTQGIAADIFITDSARRYTLIAKATAHGFTGIGVAKDFIHLDKRPTTPRVWIY